MTARVGTRGRSHSRHFGVAAWWLHLRRVVGYDCWRPAVRYTGGFLGGHGLGGAGDFEQVA